MSQLYNSAHLQYSHLNKFMSIHIQIRIYIYIYLISELSLTRWVALTNRHFPTSSRTHFCHSSWCLDCSGRLWLWPGDGFSWLGCGWPAAMNAVPSGCLIRSTPVPGVPHTRGGGGGWVLQVGEWVEVKVVSRSTAPHASSSAPKDGNDV